MTTREKAYSLLAILAIAVAVFVGREWLRERDARAKAESTAAVESQVIATTQRQIDAAKADQSSVARQLAEQLGRLEAEKRQPVTPEQIAAEINALLPKSAPPATVVVAAPERQANGKPGTVEAAAAVQIPDADLPDLQAYKLDCDATGLKLNACSKTSADLQDQLAGTRQQLAAEAKVASSWKAAANGGSIWHRLGHGAKCLAISGAAAYAGSRVDIRNPGVGAVVGTIAGGIGCEVF